MNSFDWSTYKGDYHWLQESTLYLTRHGSTAYGTKVETSDLDVKGIAFGPIEHYLGFDSRFEQVAQNEPDLTVYELTKFLRLASVGNPSLIELLYTDPSDHLLVTPAFERILSVRDKFLSKHIHRFAGFAHSQMADVKKSIDPNRGPGENRADLVEKYGYDTKAAMHAVRTLKMAQEGLSQHKILVRRPDAEELISIRRGAWTVDYFFSWFDREKSRMDSMYKRSTLPDEVDSAFLNRLCIELVSEHLGCPKIMLSPEGQARFLEALNNPPEPTEALKRLMREKSPFTEG
jgi:predicted nucleotidyltransferase